MADVRKTIINALVTQVKTITVANGYNTDQYETTRDIQHVDRLPSRNVSWSIIDTAPEAVVGYADGNVVVQRMGLTIRAQVPGLELKDEAASDRLNDAITDLRKLVAAASFMTGLGANTRFVTFEEIPEIAISPRRAIVRMPITVSYWYDGDTP